MFYCKCEIVRRKGLTETGSTVQYYIFEMKCVFCRKRTFYEDQDTAIFLFRRLGCAVYGNWPFLFE